MKKLLWTVIGLSFLAVGLAQQGPSQLRAIGVDTSRAEIPLEDVMSGGPPPNGIPALGFSGDWQGAAAPTRDPIFVSQEEAADWLEPQEPVIVFSLKGETRVYPLQILTWHEIVNDTVGGVPVAVTFCPLCNSALAFDRRLPLTAAAASEVSELNPDAAPVEPDEGFLEAYQAQGEAAAVTALLPVTFGVSGTLYNSNLLMFDTETSTLWSQLLGVGNVGTLSGTRLLRYPAQIVSFAEVRDAAPEALVLSRDTGFARRYGQNPYVGYDDADSPAFLFAGTPDGRLAPKARVVSIDAPAEAVAYPVEALAAAGVVNDAVGDTPVTLFWQAGTTSALDASSIASSRDVGAVGVFERTLDGRTLTFQTDGDAFVDEETGSTWNVLGAATAGPLAGEQLTRVVHDNTLWFAWAAFKPDTRIYAQ